MLIVLLLLPWVLTLLALLFIIARSDTAEYEEDDYEDYDDQDVVRVAVYEDKAYWVYDNVFYESEVTREPDFETAKPIDTMSMNPKDLNKLLKILDEIEESGKE
jgi:hypothetical protein